MRCPSPSPQETRVRARKTAYRTFSVQKKSFDRMVEEDAFLEYARYVKHSYGTPKAYVEEQLDAGKDVLLDDGVFEVTLIKKAEEPDGTE